ncbi:MAG TPA: 2-C-methyl-D-erythritol 4-phosphate cytidylyltransferase, partial [Lachnospiraceae bacterium]|nr:2-C-methyl-D-erythritol 4-phosphate cytidylyltransferase [Lachnospiraceae bacterium]
MNTALLLAGGTGSRLSAEVPKQYLSIRGRMLITYALEPLLESRFIDTVVIVAEQRWMEPILQDARQAGLSTEKISGFAIPGSNRQSSILNGLEDILCRRSGKVNREDAEDTDTVLVHDAARPLISGKLIASCYAALGGHDGVMPVLPMKDTVYLS